MHLGMGFPHENLHATEKTYENMLLVHWEIVFLAPCLPKKTWRSLHPHWIHWYPGRWQAVGVACYVCCLYPPWLS